MLTAFFYKTRLSRNSTAFFVPLISGLFLYGKGAKRPFICGTKKAVNLRDNKKRPLICGANRKANRVRKAANIWGTPYIEKFWGAPCNFIPKLLRGSWGRAKKIDNFSGAALLSDAFTYICKQKLV